MQYFGGKQKISTPISKFVNSLPPPRLYYVEPFCGSCNVASKVDIEHKILNDKNPYLIAMFQALQDGWIPPTEVTEMDYYNARRSQEAEPHVAGFVGFACSFAGKFWGGYARNKNDVYGELQKLLEDDKIHLDFLFDYFSADDLEGFLEHMKGELED